MSKIMWEFDLNKEDVREEFEDAYHGSDWKLVVWHLDQLLRNAIKYGNSYKTIEEALDDVRKELYNIVEAYGISLD